MRGGDAPRAAYDWGYFKDDAGFIIFGQGGEICNVSLGLLERDNPAGRLDRVIGV
jgi:hypothetical protein